MRLVSGLLWFFYKMLVAVTFVVYVLTYWTPSAHWLAGFLMMSLPLLLAVHLGFLLFWGLAAPRRALLPLLVLVASFPFWARTVQLGLPQRDAVPDIGPENTLEVLTYNAYKFNMFAFHSKEDTVTIVATRRWLTEQHADVLCFQEFYHYDHTPELDFRGLLRKAGYRYQAFIKNDHQGDSPYRMGAAVFSRYPIVARRDTAFSSQNGMVQVDIAWRKSIVRVIDVHLFSMTLSLYEMAAQRQYDGLKRETETTFRRMRRGFDQRGQQIKLLESWIADSPHPVIVCGDFNEIPYSYSYGQLRKRLANAFEEGGQGFGFTYRYLPYFIRIDNQFYDKEKLQLTGFRTMDEIKYSDHYPLIGRYVLK